MGAAGGKSRSRRATTTPHPGPPRRGGRGVRAHGRPSGANRSFLVIEARYRRLRVISEAVKLPSLLRFIVVVAALAGLVYGGMIALVIFVKVQPREMSQTIEIPKAAK